ncbi:uncharacterized protein LOC124257054 [Haliotis rubra]|uniref:uncharacterized protein LOC124257054 n=1 Tax=Haliotis rubra TaxID=36100 RepID=UPI001EE523A9|nr:uncharacterized protein LOC124257054 [Haliotis rubra]
MASSDIMRHVILIGVRLMCYNHIKTGCLIFIAAMAFTCFMVATIAVLLFIKGPQLFNLAALYQRPEVTRETEEPLGAVQETVDPQGTVREAEYLQGTVREAEDLQETVREAKDLDQQETVQEAKDLQETLREAKDLDQQETVQEAKDLQETEKWDECNTATRETMKPSRAPYVNVVPVQAPDAAHVPPKYAVPRNVKPVDPSPEPSGYICMHTGGSKDLVVYQPPRQTSPTELDDREVAAFNTGHYLCMDPLQEAFSQDKI